MEKIFMDINSTRLKVTKKNLLDGFLCQLRMEISVVVFNTEGNRNAFC